MEITGDNLRNLWRKSIKIPSQIDQIDIGSI